ncbi:hypothetical protein QMY57_25825 (plasmid) [Mycobacteroides abscessus subsp. abscessus]|uniref:hypothetical protein n=1 Tax=Mycobacteroides abscessus TaxID=36809 RepID=UPI001878067D|nr:hypothetical protein [Mycobacteroides abscessus]
MEANTGTRSRVSVSVWLPAAAHTQLREHTTDAMAPASLPVLARQAAAAAVAAPGGRVGIPAPDDVAVEALRDTGYRLNGLVAALNEQLSASAGAAGTSAQYRALAVRIAPAVDEVARAVAEVRLPPSGHLHTGPEMASAGQQWKLVRVTTDPGTLTRWEQTAAVAGFRSVANWIRDAMAGTYHLPIARAPALATIEARTLAGRIGGLIAQVQLAADQVAVIDRLCSGPAETASTVLAEVLESLVTYGGDIKARR